MRAGYTKVYAILVQPVGPAGWSALAGQSTVGPIATERSCLSAHVSLAFDARSRASQSFGRIIPRSLLSSPFVVVGKGLELSRNRLVSHVFGVAEQSLRCLQVLFASS